MRCLLCLWVVIAFFITGCDYTVGSDSSRHSNISSEAILAEDIPEFSGDVVVEIDDNEPAFTQDELTTKPFEEYSELDDLGRCGTAYANICEELMPEEEREPIGSVKPSGWHTVKYNDIVDGNYLYNRCHLIGFQLAGENANEENLITGTRYLNVVGMLPYEDMVADYVKRTDNHVLYRVTPIFEDQDLVALGVEMEAMSVEDKGKGVCFHVFVYNVQPGIDIDYTTGDSELAEDMNYVETTATDKDSDGMDASQNDAEYQSYILNTNTKKFHKAECSSVRDIKEYNKEEFSGKKSDLILQGYEPCKNCNP